MDVQKIFEFPLPIINKDLNKIYIETSKVYKGSLTIKNDGEGVLEGKIMSNSNFLTFNTEYFTGNHVKITYTIDLETYNTNNKITIEAFIMSNGGEHIIEFIVKIVSHSIKTEEGQNITSLKDFFSYYKKYPVNALSLFNSHNFITYLNTINYEHIDIYQHFSLDSNKERGINNFFIFNKLKYKTSLSIVSNNINIKMNPFTDKKYVGLLSIKRSGQGYAEDRLYLKNNSPWLKIEKKHITSADFKDNDSLSIAYAIDKSLVNKKITSDTLLLESGEGRVNIIVSTVNFLSIYLEKKYMDIKDKGNLIINNNTEEDIYIEIVPRDNFLKFEKGIYKVHKYERVPFYIKLSALQLAQKSIKKKPVFETDIYISSYYKDLTYRKNLKLFIGNFV